MIRIAGRMRTEQSFPESECYESDMISLLQQVTEGQSIKEDQLKSPIPCHFSKKK
jgi:hypothetical protein